MIVLRACLAVAFAIATAGLAPAQSAPGAIEGLVVDPSGAVLPGVTVTLRQPVAAVERASRDIPLGGRVRAQLIAEAFNLFNRGNINSVINVRYGFAGTTLTPTANFGRPNATAGERIVQRAARLTF